MSSRLDLGPEELERAGLALFGERWQSQLGRELGYDDSSRIRKFMSENENSRPIPPKIWGDLVDILKKRQRLIDEVIHLLES